jgi:hypothetical protein
MSLRFEKPRRTISRHACLVRRLAPVAAAAIIHATTHAPAALAHDFGHWSPAVSVDHDRSIGINTAANDGCPIEAPDGRMLVFASNRIGSLDLWIALRDSKTSAWGAPEPLPSPVNTAANEFCPTPLPGNQLLFVSTQSNACGGANNADIYYTQLHPARGWLTPQPLDCHVNSAFEEFSPSVVTSHGTTMLFFSSNREDGVHHKIYVSVLRRDGTWRPAEPVDDLNWPGAADARPNVRRDGLEIVFDSNRAGGFDIYTSTRSTIFEPWSRPRALGPNVNSASDDETRASLSRDGKRLYFGSTRANAALGGSGADIYVSTRGDRGKHKD